MEKLIHCAHFKKELPALNEPPLTGELGLEVLSRLSADGWSAWIEIQTQIINEESLHLLDRSNIVYLHSKLRDFMNGELDNVPGYVPIQSESGPIVDSSAVQEFDPK
ncbi:Fe(2+)-trafficking protein [Vibrio splendidus]